MRNLLRHAPRRKNQRNERFENKEIANKSVYFAFSENNRGRDIKYAILNEKMRVTRGRGLKWRCNKQIKMEGKGKKSRTVKRKRDAAVKSA